MFDFDGFDDFDDQEYRLAPPTARSDKHREKESEPKPQRKILRVHGVSVDNNGKWWFACSEGKGKTFHYISHEEMKLKYASFLLQYYERHLRLESTDTPNDENV